MAQLLPILPTSSHIILSVSVTLGSFLFFQYAKLFPTPEPLHLLFPSLGTCFFIFSMTDFLIHHVAPSSKRPGLTTLVRHHLWSLTPLFFFLSTPHAFFFHKVYYIMQLSCYFFACLFSVSPSPTSAKRHCARAGTLPVLSTINIFST